MLPLLAVGAMGAGAALNYAAGRKASKAQERAMADFQREQKRLMEAKAVDQYEIGKVGQDATSKYLGMLSSTMGVAPSAAPRSSEFAPSEPAGMDPAQAAAYRAAFAPKAAVSNARLAADQSGMDRTALGRALQALGYNTQIPIKGRQTQSRRNQFMYDAQLADAQAKLAGFRQSNSIANMQLLGGLLNTAGQMGLMYSAFGGAGPAPGAVETAGATTGLNAGGAAIPYASPSSFAGAYSGGLPLGIQ